MLSPFTKKYYLASDGTIITNNYYTSQAVCLARIFNIHLCDREKLWTVLYKSTRL